MNYGKGASFRTQMAMVAGKKKGSNVIGVRRPTATAKPKPAPIMPDDDADDAAAGTAVMVQPPSKPNKKNFPGVPNVK